MLTLGDIERAPERVSELSPEEALAIAQRAAALQMALVIRAQTRQSDISDERFLNLEEAAGRMSVTPHWLQRNARTLPFATKMGREWRFSQSGLAKWLRKRTG